MTTERTKKDTITTVGHSIPLDLIFEILLKLPSKSVLRFKSVSKSWLSIIRSQQFIDAFMSLSLTQPRLVLSFKDCYDDQMLFFSSPHRNSSFLSSSSMLVAENYNLKMPKFIPHSDYICSAVRGFLCCNLEDEWLVCNPTTGQVIPLSENNNDICIQRMFLGYDPNNNQYKVLRLTSSKSSGPYMEHSVRTLGGQRSSNSWRPIKTSILYYPCGKDGVCIDGVVYYLCINNDYKRALIRFDVGSEQLRTVETPKDLTGRLTNYLGKLAVHGFSFIFERFILWVLDDVKNQDWSSKTCLFPSYIYNAPSELPIMHFGGIAASGEIVYVLESNHGGFELFCYDVEKKMSKRIRLEGLEKIHRSFFSLFFSYVDNILHL